MARAGGDSEGHGCLKSPYHWSITTVKYCNSHREGARGGEKGERGGERLGEERRRQTGIETQMNEAMYFLSRIEFSMPL